MALHCSTFNMALDVHSEEPLPTGLSFFKGANFMSFTMRLALYQTCMLLS
jgi:hypothetical protein